MKLSSRSTQPSTSSGRYTKRALLVLGVITVIAVLLAAWQTWVSPETEEPSSSQPTYGGPVQEITEIVGTVEEVRDNELSVSFLPVIDDTHPKQSGMRQQNILINTETVLETASGSLSSISEGDSLLITSDNNLLGKESITATRIQHLSSGN